MAASEISISTSLLRRQVHDVLNAVRLNNAQYTVLFHQKPIARLIPVPISLQDSQTEAQTLSASEFRDSIHQVLDTVEYQQQKYIIQKRGIDVAQLTPVEQQPSTVGKFATRPIISLVSLKGGVGKTTSTMHLAAVAAREGHSVTVLDGDNEHSALHWSQLAEQLGKLPFTVLACEERTVISQARDLQNQGVTVFIDTPPNDRALLMKAAGIADHILVPVAPTGIDLDRLRGTLQLLSDTGDMGHRDLDIAILLVRFVARKALAREAEEVLKEFPILSTRIRALKPYEEAFGNSPTYLEEYTEVWKELVS